MKKTLSAVIAVAFAAGGLNINYIPAFAETAAVDGEKHGLIFEEDFESYTDGDNLLTVGKGKWTQEKAGWGTVNSIIADPTNERGGLVFAAKNQMQTGLFRHKMNEGQYRIEAKMYDPGSQNNKTIAAMFAPMGAAFNNYIGIQEKISAKGSDDYYARMNTNEHKDTGIARSKGWKTIGIDFLTDPGKVRYYVDDEYIEISADNAKADGVGIGTVWENSAADAPDVYFDDIRIYGNIPYVSGLYPEIAGTTIRAEYTYGFDSEADPVEGATTYKWYVSDSQDGEYTEVDGETERSFSPSPDTDGDIWIKVEVTPMNKSGTLSGEATMSNSVKFSGSIFKSLPSAADVTINTSDDVLYTGSEYTAQWQYSSPVGNEEEGTRVYWQVSEDGTSEFVNIEGADKPEYTPDKSLGGKYIRVCVIPCDATGLSGAEAYSEAFRIKSSKYYYEAANAAADASEMENILLELAGEIVEGGFYKKLPGFDRLAIAKLIRTQVPFSSDEQLSAAFEAAAEMVMQDNTENKYSVIISEDFEDDELQFSPVNGAVVVDERQSLSGERASHFLSDSRTTHQIVLDDAGYYRYVAYMYDDVSDANNMTKHTPQVAFMPKFDGVSYVAVGMEGNGMAYYRYRIGGSSVAWKNSPVERSTGWHKIAIDYTEETGVKIYIDAVLVYDGSTDTTNTANEWLYKADCLEIGNFWGNLGVENLTSVDDVCVETKAGPYAKDISLTQTGKLLSLSFSIVDPWNSEADSNYETDFEWYRSDTQTGEYSIIEGADKSSYTVTVDDMDKWIRAKITASDNGTYGNAQFSPSVLESYIGDAAPKVTDVAISGTPTVSKTVTGTFNVSKTVFDPDEGRNIYKWYISEKADGEYTQIVNNTNEYKSDVENAGKYVKFAVSVCDTDGNYSRWQESAPVHDETTLDDVLQRIAEGGTANGDILNILNRYSSSFSNLSQSRKETVIMKLLNQKTTRASDFEKIISDVNSGSSYSGGGSSSGGGGGGGGSSSGGIIKPSTGGFIANADKLANPVTEETWQEPDKIDFADLDNVSWAKEAIDELANRGIITGRSNTIFDPEAAITREEFAAIMVRMFGWTAEGASSFSDADSGAWYYPALAAAEEKKVINGISDNIFGVGLDITREDMAVMAYRFLNKSGNILPDYGENKTFDDYDDISDYAKEAVIALANGNIVNGSEGLFSARNTATRAMVAQIAYNMLGLIKE